MFKYFKWSFVVLALGLVFAFLRGDTWGASFSLLLSALAIIVIEISLSFDNAVVNAIKLEKMNKVWRRRFLTWGILIAVFGMRFVFPFLIVAIFSNISMLTVLNLTLTNPDEYSRMLAESHYGIASFGSMFLMMLFMSFMFEQEKENWISIPEKIFKQLGKIKFSKEIIAFIFLGLLQFYLKEEQRIISLVAGGVGIFLHTIIEFFAKKFEPSKEIALDAAKNGLVSFIYLEIIDASFSLDGVLGAFAVTKDIIVITIGLTVGAVFVRSLTIMLVEKKTLEKFPYLQHGAYWAVGVLSAIMLYSAIEEVSEYITAVASIAFILASIVSSLLVGMRPFSLRKFKNMLKRRALKKKN